MVHATTKHTGLGVAGFLLAVIVDGVDISNRHVVGLLYGSLNLKFVGLTINDEAVAVQLFAQNRHLFSYYWLN